jgi:hypothetical protein
VRLCPTFDELHGIESLIPSEDFAVHLQPALNDLLGPK